MKGYIHIYTGDGKGKTTAALGLAIRAAGAGLQVFFAQFIKGRQYSELNTLSRLSDQISVEHSVCQVSSLENLLCLTLKLPVMVLKG